MTIKSFSGERIPVNLRRAADETCMELSKYGIKLTRLEAYNFIYEQYNNNKDHTFSTLKNLMINNYRKKKGGRLF